MGKKSMIVKTNAFIRLIGVLTIISFGMNSCEDDFYEPPYHHYQNVNRAKDTIYLYKETFSSSDLSNWTNTEDLYYSKGLFIKEKGNSTYLKNFYSLNHRTARVTFTISANTKFTMGTMGCDILDMNNLSTIRPQMNIITIDVKNQKVNCANKEYDFDLKENNLYEISLTTNDQSYNYTLINKTKKDTLKMDVVGGECNDFYGLYLDEGTSPFFKSFTVETDRHPYIIFCGNSITHGAGTTIVNYHPVNAYSYMVGDSIGKAFLLSAKVGSNIHHVLGNAETTNIDYTGRLFSEIIPLKPKYVMITIGTNAWDTYDNLSLLVNILKNNGITPLLNNIPCYLQNPDGNWYELSTSVNEIIESVREDNGVNGARLNIPTSIDKLGERCDTTLYENLGTLYIHPNNTGHQAMVEQIKLDCPEIFKQR